MLKTYKVCANGIGYKHDVNSCTVGFYKPLNTPIEGVSKEITDKAYVVVVRKDIEVVHYFIKDDERMYCADMI